MGHSCLVPHLGEGWGALRLWSWLGTDHPCSLAELLPALHPATGQYFLFRYFSRLYFCLPLELTCVHTRNLLVSKFSVLTSHIPHSRLPGNEAKPSQWLYCQDFDRTCNCPANSVVLRLDLFIGLRSWSYNGVVAIANNPSQCAPEEVWALNPYS